MAGSGDNSLLVISRRGPYDGQLARSALELALANAAFDRPVSLLLLGEGVRQLQTGQAPPAGRKNQARMMASLPLYDIDTVYVDETALRRYGIEPFGNGPQLKLLDAEGIRALCAADHQVIVL